MQIGPYALSNNLVVAPMAGITDRPFRQLCKRLGAGYAVSEMAAANPLLRNTPKSRRRVVHEGEVEPRAVQIVGSDPATMADSARYNVDQGAQIIDINMGCPAKKVCNNWCGSALLQNEPLVGQILEAVTNAVPVPVTLKFRTGWNRSHINAPAVAKIAESAGIAMLTLHGRTREDGYRGEAEYDTIAEVKSLVSIPVVANGDIDSPEKARAVLKKTGADAIMIGRGAQGRPWIFREIDYFLKNDAFLPPPDFTEVWEIVREHLQEHYAFYGEAVGVRTARKHIGWYAKNLPSGEKLRDAANRAESCETQINEVDRFFMSLLEGA